MRQAITVEFLGPTNTKGPRWKATCAAKSRAFDQSDNLNRDNNARVAAMQLAAELGLAWHVARGRRQKRRVRVRE